MILAAIVVFALAAVGGSVLAATRAKDKPTPMAVSAGHGLAAAVGLVLLVVGLVQGGTPSTYGSAALGAFALAALGGFALLVMRVLGKPPSLGVIAGHAVVAVIALVLLVVSYVGA